MEHPQTFAENILKHLNNLESIAKYGCCALTVLWWVGVDAADKEAISIINDAINAGVIGEDCTVKWKGFISWLTGREVDVDFIDIVSIKNIKEKTIVRYDYNGKYHWVGVENGKVVFNSLEKSVCVEKGKPTTARVIRIKNK